MTKDFRPFRTALYWLAFLVCISSSPAQAPRADKVIGGYFEEWGIHYGGFTLADLQKNGVANELTHLIYAFGDVTPTSTPTCAIEDPSAAYLDSSLPSVSGKPYTAPPYGNFGAILQLKELHPHLKVLISLGGQAGNSAGWVSAAATPAGRVALASSCIDLFVKGNIAPGVHAPGLFDGFNIDWEFPSSADKQNFTALLKEFRTQLDTLSKSTGKRYVLTFDSPSDPKKYANIDLKAAAEQVDFLTIDGYDLATPDDKQTNQASSLYAAAAKPSLDGSPAIDATVKAYLKAGVPAAKYTMGLPLYAVGWKGVANVNHGLYQKATGPAPVPLVDGSGICPRPNKADPSPGCDTILTPGFLTYTTIEKFTGTNGFTAWYDSARVAAMLYNPSSGIFYTYDTPASVATKTAYIREKKLGGAYVWALNDDDSSGSLTKAVAAGLKKSNTISHSKVPAN
ncbi:glycoside hydrolase family 18 protein [Terracidiphilus gabretensis]|uniref:glycoside hydrolase family 18 protein n=1 Tax=Terracidiphilus gabretensis TaxID=1577687 RepID=UPI00071BFB75|nr:glycosyl hydrolase family 18 protein [Terracidiphilus gabretensis]